MDEYSHNVIRHGVKQKSDGRHRLRRLLTMLGYFLFVLGYTLLFTVPVKMYPALGGGSLFLYGLYRITWWRLEFDYDYRIAHGELTVEKVYHANRRRTLLCVPLRALTEVAPIGAVLPRGRVYDYRGSVRAEHGYYAAFRDGAGRPALLLFVATRKMVGAMAKYCENTVMAEGLPR